MVVSLVHESTPEQTGKKQVSSSGEQPARTLPRDDFPTPVECKFVKPLLFNDFSKKLERFNFKTSFVIRQMV